MGDDMDEIRCPLCGKLNSKDLDVCQFCDARLKPLKAGQPEENDITPESQGAGDDEFISKDEDVPDWLADLRGNGVVDDESPEDSGEELPDWLLEEDDGIEAGEDKGDWLDDLRSQDSGKYEGSPQEKETEDEEGEFSGKQKEQQVSNLLDEKEGEEEEELAPGSREFDTLDAQSEEDGEIPDWLSKVRSRKEAEDAGLLNALIEDDEGFELEGEDKKTEDDGQPDEDDQPAIEELDSESERGFQQSPFTSEISGQLEEDLPEWLSEFKESTSEGDEIEDELEDKPEVPEPSPDTLEDLPDWLTGIEGKEEDYEFELEADEIHDWLDEVQELPDESEEPQIDEGEVEIPEGEKQLSHSGDEEQEREKEQAEPLSESELVSPFSPDQVPEDLFSEEAPDWLEQVDHPLEPVEISSAQPDEDFTSLTPADVPDWLKSKRPIESAISEMLQVDESEDDVEGGGPLGGMRGILPAEPEIASLKRPPTFSLDLKVTDNQQAHVALLEELLETEQKPRPVSGILPISSKHILRILIFICLVIAVSWAVIMGNQLSTLPDIVPEVFDATQLVNRLPQDASVLIEVDYEPGLIGEMEAASLAVVDHLMVKGTYLALVSTSPTGPAQIERLISKANNVGDHQYDDVNQYANLGYIPGGTPSLLGFSESPRTIVPYGQDGSRIWENEPIRHINRLADFDLVVVITENTGSGREWIEQIQPGLGETPLLMITSAQAEPIIRPYYQSSPKQVQGMIAGVYGGVSYEKTMSRTIIASKYWEAFGIGILVSVLIILIGGAINIFIKILSDRDQKEGENII